MLALAGVVFLGTMWPVISKLWSANPVAWTPGSTTGLPPLFVAVTALVAFGPHLSWPAGSGKGLGLSSRCSHS
jgi:cytochrome c-type biogenesis protein CcmF